MLLTSVIDLGADSSSSSSFFMASIRSL
ncbi:DUF3678 domain-containing protein [Candidatus Woesearchaeota archaeon]|nr:DUF3678 domain-containing protein [Candidatus Woesearchaeota archaeon]